MNDWNTHRRFERGALSAPVFSPSGSNVAAEEVRNKPRREFTAINIGCVSKGFHPRHSADEVIAPNYQLHSSAVPFRYWNPPAR